MSADGTVRRRDALLQWRDWSLTTKLAAVVLVPVISAITLGIGQVRWQVDRADEFNRIERVLGVVDHVEPLVEQLQNERTGAVQYLTRDGAPIDGQIAASDQAVGALRQAFADPAALGPVVRDRYGELQGALGKLAGLRQQVSNRQLQPVDAVHAYSELIGAVVSVDRALTTAITDPDLSSNATALQTVLSTMEEVRLQQALVLTGLTDGELPSSTVTELSASHARLQMLIAEGRSTVSAKWSHRLDAVVSSPEVAQRNGLLTKIIEESTDNKHGGSYSVNRQVWNQLSDASVAQIDSGHNDLAKDVRDSAFRLEDDASNSAGWDSVLLLSALIAAAAVIIVITRQLLRSLHQLRRSALDAAEYELPEAVDRIRAGAKDTDLDPVPVDTADEIGQVARAFDAVNRQALRLAAEQSDLRRGYSEVFVSVSRRSQGLLERQLRLFEQLEQDEEDPDQLSRLFQLDHLATRMRRNNENLMVLSGHDLARRFVRPTDLADVLRAAVSEIEQYPRVVVQPPPQVKLLGHAASDLVRLLAELMDNAANFSAPDTTVSASGYQAGDGSVVIDVLDQGIGMGHEELVAANERLTRVDENDLATSRRMGLFVAGRLAVRHNIGVELHGGPDVEGVRATITVPAEHVVGGAELFGEGEVEVGHGAQRAGRVGGAPAAVAVDVELDAVAEVLAQRAAGFDVERVGPAAHLDLEGGDAVLGPDPLGFGDHLLRRGESHHVRDPHVVGVPAEQLGHRLFEGAAEGVPDGHVDGGLGGGVADGAVHPGVQDLPLGQPQPHEVGGQHPVDDGDDGGLGLAVGERPGRGLGDTGDAVVGAHPHQHVLGRVHLAAGEAQRLAVRHGERDRLNSGDLHGAPRRRRRRVRPTWTAGCAAAGSRRRCARPAPAAPPRARPAARTRRR